MKLEDQFRWSEFRLAKEVIRAFNRADCTRPRPNPELVKDCMETLREGNCLIIYSHRPDDLPCREA